MKYRILPLCLFFALSGASASADPLAVPKHLRISLSRDGSSAPGVTQEIDLPADSKDVRIDVKNGKLDCEFVASLSLRDGNYVPAVLSLARPKAGHSGLNDVASAGPYMRLIEAKGDEGGSELLAFDAKCWVQFIAE